MYRIIFTPSAAEQYADTVEILSKAPKKLANFENEMEDAIRRLEKMPESYSLKGNLRAARLKKSEYYLFYELDKTKKLVTIVLLISQKADQSQWPG